MVSEKISEHLVFKNFLGKHAPRPPSFCRSAHALINTWSYQSKIAGSGLVYTHFQYSSQAEGSHLGSFVACLYSAWFHAGIDDGNKAIFYYCMQYPKADLTRVHMQPPILSMKFKRLHCHGLSFTLTLSSREDISSFFFQLPITGTLKK